MNNYQIEDRKRKRSLLIVEGEREKDELFNLIFQCFPELDIDINDIWVYGTNIYKLYNNIVEYYDEDWIEQDIDLPLIISRKENMEQVRYKVDFNNIILVFDYERQDPNFSKKNIEEMQNYFKDSTDVGKLYLNYPMLESYKHLKSLSDGEYLERKIEVSLLKKGRYKQRVNEESEIRKILNFSNEIEKVFARKGLTIDKDKVKDCCNKILNISSDDKLEEELENILHIIGNAEEERKLKFNLKDKIIKAEYIQKKITYWDHIRKNFQEIIYFNICKAYKIQEEKDEEDLKAKFNKIELLKILETQNKVSLNKKDGFIWVLNTCVFLIPDYNFDLIK